MNLGVAPSVRSATPRLLQSLPQWLTDFSMSRVSCEYALGGATFRKPAQQQRQDLHFCCPTLQTSAGVAHCLVCHRRQLSILARPSFNWASLPQNRRDLVSACAGMALLLAGAGTVALCQDESPGSTAIPPAEPQPPAYNEHTAKWRLYTNKAAQLAKEVRAVQFTLTMHISCRSGITVFMVQQLCSMSNLAERDFSAKLATYMAHL